MTTKDDLISLSPTVLQVIDQFTNAMQGDDGIDNDAIDRLEKLLQKGAIPKPDEINTALFVPTSDDEK